MRVIICGSRDWTDFEPIQMIIEGCNAYPNTDMLTIIHGDARGADRIAGGVARSLGITEEAHPADWVGRGRAAGPIRNKLMLDLGADLVVAFKDNFDHDDHAVGGTEHMIRLARKAGVRTMVVCH